MKFHVIVLMNGDLLKTELLVRAIPGGNAQSGLRGSRRFAFSDHASISPFFGPAYERVRALDEAIETPVSIGRLMLLGFERRISEVRREDCVCRSHI